jgi:phospholipid/cholesterol/gamma-HCH transport system substrate-binding protein
VSDYESLQRRRNFVVGIFVVLGLCAFGWLVFRFGDLPSGITKMHSFQVCVQFRSAPGVQKDTPVRFCGYQIGRVTAVDPPRIRAEMRDGQQTELRYHQTLVTLSIHEDYTTIPDTSKVMLMSRGLGSSYIEIKAPLPEPNYPPTDYFTHGTIVQGSTGVTSEFFPEESQKKLEELLDELRALAVNTNDIVGNKANKQNVKIILDNVNSATEEFNSTLKEANTVLDEASKALGQYRQLASVGIDTVKHTDAKIAALVTAIIGTSEQLGKAAAQMRLLMQKSSDGEGTMGKFINDGRLYENLLETTDQLQILIQQLSVTIKAINEQGLRDVYKKGAQ